jgi:hypothetical protein
MKEILQPGQSFSSPAFDKNNMKDYRLSIGLSLDGFSFLLMDEKQNILSLNTVHFQPEHGWDAILPALKEHISSFSWIGNVMKNKVALADTARFTLMPFALYEHKEKRLYVELNHPVHEDDSIKDDMLKSHRSYVIYALPQQVFNKINMWIPGIFWKHYAANLINCIADSYQPDTKVVADVRDKRFYVMAFSENRLKFCNAFRYQNKEDFVYFLLLVYKQLKMSPADVPLRISGLLKKESQIDQLLRKYIRQVDYGDQTPVANGKESSSIRAYEYENLKTAAFCG